MDIIYLCHRIPYPPNKGDKIRAHAILAHLAKNHRVHLACFVDDPADFAHVQTVRRLAGGECLFVPLRRAAKWAALPRAIVTGKPITTAYFGKPEIAQWLDVVVKNHPTAGAFVFSSAMAHYILDRPTMNPSRAVLDLVDIDSDKWRQYAAQSRGLRGWIFRREAAALLQLERRAARQFSATVLASPYEADCFKAMAPESAARIFPLSNGVDANYFSPNSFPNPFPEGEIAIAMTGRMDYEPNIDAVKWFLAEIMPRLRNILPNVRFYAVGANPPRSLRRRSGPEFELTGYVDDVRPYLQHASAVVAPLRIARGVQNKVLEAMAMARPVVATSAATRALAVSSGVHLWIEDEPDAFANAVIRALRGDERHTIAWHAREYIESHHAWKHTLSSLDKLLMASCAASYEHDARNRIPRGHGMEPTPSFRAHSVADTFP